MEFKRKAIAVFVGQVCAAAFTVAALPVAAQESQSAERVTITGSNIKRVDSETASPVQVIGHEDIMRSGATTAQDLLEKVSANVGGYPQAGALGDAARPGLASASMRGLGSSNTLVLLNGRRLSNHAFDSGAADLNTIPLAVIDRVEVLKDGASAIYGSDAIGGVINFITRSDFTGGEVSAFADATQHKGGDKWQTSFAFGAGNLATDRFNVTAAVDYSKETALKAIDRSFARTAYIPGAGVNKLSSNAYPANILTGNGFVNPAFASGCQPPVSLAVGGRCRYDYASQIDIMQPQEKTSFYTRGAFKINEDHQLFAELNWVRNVVMSRVSQTPVSEATTFSGNPLLYPSGGAFYPTGLGLTGDLNLYWRSIAAGLRSDEATAETTRFVTGGKGVVAGWDYEAAYTYNESKTKDVFTDGWLLESKLLPAMATGLINPFGAQTSQGQALLNGTKLLGEVRNAKGKTDAVDFKASKDIAQLPGGTMGLALGGEFRKEEYRDNPFDVVRSGDVLGFGGNLQPQGGTRNVKALFAELSVPIVKNLEGQVAVRWDSYSDVGNTTNPKVGFKWTPSKQFALRGSYNTGFHAPTLYDLYSPTVTTNTPNVHDDPIRCPGGVAINPATAGQDCALQFNEHVGGNPALKPEKSTQWSIGAIAEPIHGVSVTVDYFNIERKDTIGTLSDDLIFGNTSQYSSLIVRNAPTAADQALGLPGGISYLSLPTFNLGKIQTSGIDVSVLATLPKTGLGRIKLSLDGTRVLRYKYQVEKDGEVFDNLGKFAFVADGSGSGYRIIPRWRHTVGTTWELDAWAVTLANNYSSSYEDANAEGQTHRVGAYSTWDLVGTWRGIKDVTIMAGIKNLFDKDPPFTNSGQNFQVGFEPKLTNPRGRSFMLKGIYRF
jgi:iron complex outermembrane recepter protein